MLTAKPRRKTRINTELLDRQDAYNHDTFISNFENWMCSESNFSERSKDNLIQELEFAVDRTEYYGIELDATPVFPTLACEKSDVSPEETDTHVEVEGTASDTNATASAADVDTHPISEEDRLALCRYTKNILQNIVGHDSYPHNQRYFAAVLICLAANVPQSVRKEWNLS